MNQTYYLNGPDLQSSTGVYQDSGMTILSPDGFYQQGGVTRQLLDGVLLPEQTCLECSQSCGGMISYSGSDTGVYKMNIEVGDGTGAVIIKVYSPIVPIGLSAQYNSAVYNKFSSPTYGYMAAPVTEVTYIGEQYFDCGLVSGSPYNLDVYRWNGTDFEQSTGETENITITDGQLELNVTNPGESVMVIPKTSTTPSVVELTVICACSSYFDVEVECVAELTGYTSSQVYGTSIETCEAVSGETYYSVPVNGDGITLGLYDWVFADINGNTLLGDGYYYADIAVPGSDDWYRVENGVIVEFGTCPSVALLPFVVDKEISVACGYNVTDLRLQAYLGFIPVLDVYYPDTGSIPVIAGTYSFKISFTWANITPGCCDMELVIKYGVTELATLALPTPPVNGDYYELEYVGQLIPPTLTLRGFIRCI